jgi:hypothetical protein
MADDVDFVTVAAVYLHGRADFEKFTLETTSAMIRLAGASTKTC